MKDKITPTSAVLLPQKGDPPEREDWLTETLRHVRDTQFGQVTLTIHQGEVIEVQKTEKRRFARARRDP